MRTKNKNRKERADKKREVRPSLSMNLAKHLEILSEITGKPMKDVGEIMTYEGIHTHEILNELNPHFRRHVRLENVVYYGKFDAPRMELDGDGIAEKQRVCIKFKRRDYEDVHLLATTLDVTPSRAIALLLDVCLRDINVVKEVIKTLGYTDKENVNVPELERNLIGYVRSRNEIKRPWYIRLLRRIA